MDDTATAVADAPSSSASSGSTQTSTADTSASSPAQTVTTDRPSIGEALKGAERIVAEHQAKGKRGRITTTGDPSSTELPTTQAEGVTDPTQAVTTAGPVPTPVHIKAVENARQKGRQEAEQQFRQTVGDPQVAGEAMRWFNRAAQDRGGFVREIVNEALNDPQLRQEVLSLAGRTLGQRAEPKAATMPEPDFQDANGNKFYSAAQQQKRDEWLSSELEAKILGQVQPDLEQVRSEREQRQQEQAQQRNAAAINSHITEARTWPHFEQHKKQIAEIARSMPLTSGHPAEEAAVLTRAYWQVVGPKLSQLEQQRVVADLKARANASSLNPSATGAPTGVPKNITAKGGGSFGDALKWAQTQTAGR